VSFFLFLGSIGFWTNLTFRVFPYLPSKWNEYNSMRYLLNQKQNIEVNCPEEWFVQKMNDSSTHYRWYHNHSVIFQIQIKHIFRNQSFYLILFDSLGVRFWKITVNCEDLWTAYLRKYFYLNYFRNFSLIKCQEEIFFC